MLSVFRPSFEVVKEGRILKKSKHLQNILDVFGFTPELNHLSRKRDKWFFMLTGSKGWWKLPPFLKLKES